MRINRVKAILKAGGTVIGSEVSRFRTPEIVQIFAAADFDFVFIDMEHTSFTLETVADMIKIARLMDIVPIVRVPDAEYHLVARVLDAGAQGIMLPRLTGPQQVEEVVSWLRYPPEGIRGIALTPDQTEYKAVEVGDFIKQAQRETLLVIQIERKKALENLDEMLSVPGVDVAALGYMDLSVDLGIPGQIEHPLMESSIEAVIEACRRYGVSAGMIAPNMEILSHWAERGVRFLSYSSDALMLLEAASAAVRRLRGNQRRG
jgi:2-keto-3-deoxy-L-rhamnonate aldolase RhmA